MYVKLLRRDSVFGPSFFASLTDRLFPSADVFAGAR